MSIDVDDFDVVAQNDVIDIDFDCAPVSVEANISGGIAERIIGKRKYRSRKPLATGTEVTVNGDGDGDCLGVDVGVRNGIGISSFKRTRKAATTNKSVTVSTKDPTSIIIISDREKKRIIKKTQQEAKLVFENERQRIEQENQHRIAQLEQETQLQIQQAEEDFKQRSKLADLARQLTDETQHRIQDAAKRFSDVEFNRLVDVETKRCIELDKRSAPIAQLVFL